MVQRNNEIKKVYNKIKEINGKKYHVIIYKLPSGKYYSIIKGLHNGIVGISPLTTDYKKSVKIAFNRYKQKLKQIKKQNNINMNKDINSAIQGTNSVSKNNGRKNITQKTPNKIMFGDEIAQYFKGDWDKASRYIEKRNKMLADMLYKQLSADKYDSYQDFVKARDSLLQQLISRYGGQIDWNSRDWRNTIDNIYRNVLIKLKQSGYKSWEDFYNKSRASYLKEQGQKKRDYTRQMQSGKANEQYLNTVSEQERQGPVKDSGDKYVSKLKQVSGALRAKGYNELADYVDLITSEAQYNQNIKKELIDNYTKLIKSIEGKIDALAKDYGYERGIIEEWLKSKFGEVENKISQLDKITEDLYQQGLQNIQKAIGRKANILEGLSRKGAISEGQAYATTRQVEADYNKDLQQLQENYLKNKRTLLSDTTNLYRNWLNELQEGAYNWGKALYDTAYEDIKGLEKGLTSLNERLEKDYADRLAQMNTNYGNIAYGLTKNT